MKNYKVLLYCDIDENRQLVLSEDLTNDEFVIAQCFLVNENGRKKRIFQKGSIIINKNYIGNIFDAFSDLTEIVEE